MDEQEVDRIVDNEREWRRHLVKKVDEVQKDQGRLREDFAAIKVWLWVGRFIVITVFGGIITWVKLKIA